MPPQIRYARTSDGVGIAFFTYGEGDPLVVLPSSPFGHIQLEWAIPRCRNWYERLAEGRTLVCYDLRGSGLSDRELQAYSVRSMLLDVEAVADHLKLARFALFAPNDLGAVGIAYAAAHPERVSHLIVWGGYPHGSDLDKAPETESWIALMDKDWGVVTQGWAHNMTGWADAELARSLAALWRVSCAPEALPAFWNATLEYDVEDLLAAVRAPTLILHRRDVGVAPIDAARRMAAKIPDARLTLLDGSAGMPFAGDSEAVIEAIEDFLGRRGPAPVEAQSPRAQRRDTAIILFTDICDSAALTERMGDAAFRDASRTLDERMRDVMRQTGGTPVEGKVLGDGVMAVFASAAQAIEAARGCEAASIEVDFSLHIGIHAGDVIREPDNVYGGAVNIASRICGLSQPGEILVSATVRDLARTSAGVAFEDRGEHALKGIAEPVRVFAVSSP